VSCGGKIFLQYVTLIMDKGPDVVNYVIQSAMSIYALEKEGDSKLG
jgi:hypothetical protein